MKHLMVILMLILFPFTTGMVSRNTIVLTADQVSSARDIEIAIEEITGYGTWPGTVILDSSKGDFYYTGDDKSINIYYSNITLRSKNGATIVNCDDGIFIDNLPADHIFIEGITFVCRGNGVSGWGGEYLHDRVIIRKNTFHVQMNGIEMGSVKNWRILNNFIYSGNYAVHFIDGRGIRIVQNELYGFIGIYLQETDRNKAAQNEMHVIWQGVLIGHGSHGNKVHANLIIGPQSSGIAFEGDNFKNVVIRNKVSCAQGAECLVVAAYPQAYKTNKIAANTYFKTDVLFDPDKASD